MFGVQELATAVQFNIGVVTLVFNNNAYGNVRRDQRERFDGRVVASDLVNPDFVKLAESFGVGAARVTSPQAFRAGAGKGAGRRRALSDRHRSAQGFRNHAVDVHPSGEAVNFYGSFRGDAKRRTRNLRNSRFALRAPRNDGNI